MHIRTNIELNIVHLATLAICPVMFFVTYAKDALCVFVMVFFAFLLSMLVCALFNKYLSSTVKVFVTAMVSCLVVTILNFLLDKYNILGLNANDMYYLAVLSTVVLSVDIYYIDTKAVVGRISTKIISAILFYFGILMVFSIFKEILGFGSIFGKVISNNFAGIEFFRGTIFSLIFLGIICAVVEAIYGYIRRKVYDKQMVYEKFVKKIRDEKMFQYDNLRRKKMLASPIDVRTIGNEEFKIIQEKSDVNETVEDNTSGSDLEDGESKEEIKPKKKKKNRRLKVSKEAKVEKMFDRKSDKGDE